MIKWLRSKLFPDAFLIEYVTEIVLRGLAHPLCQELANDLREDIKEKVTDFYDVRHWVWDAMRREMIRHNERLSNKNNQEVKKLQYQMDQHCAQLEDRVGIHLEQMRDVINKQFNKGNTNDTNDNN